MDNDISWDKEVLLQQLPLTYSSQREQPWFSPAGRGLRDVSLQKKLGRNCGGEGEADKKGFKPHYRTFHGAEEEDWEGTGEAHEDSSAELAIISCSSCQNTRLKTGGRVKS